MQHSPFVRIAPELPGLLQELQNALPIFVLGIQEPRMAAGVLAAMQNATLSEPLARTAAGLAAWNWQWRPLDSGDASRLLAAHKARSFVPESCLGPVRFAHNHCAKAPEVPDILQAMAERDLRYFVPRLAPGLEDQTRGPALLSAVWGALVAFGSLDLAGDMLARTGLETACPPLYSRLRAELAVFLDAPEAALDLLRGLDPDIWCLWRGYHQARLTARLGEPEQAGKELLGLWTLVPWHVNLALGLYESLQTPLRPQASGADEAAVCIYSWNKADLLRQTLDSLAASELGRARIAVLDNGSGDATVEVVAQAAERFGPERFSSVRLPVNAGAPAARQWLLSLPEVARCEYAAFLDDDVVLPEHWLTTLLGAARQSKKPGCVGCRIVSTQTPPGLQSADYHLFPPSADPNAERINVFDNTAGALDSGLFDYARPALSVSGCCHLVSMASVRDVGGFDIRFSPTQFDDLDRDIRLNAAGYEVLYAGILAVGHVQHSSLAKAKDDAQVGQVMGNKLKLEAKHHETDLAGLHRRLTAKLWQDLRAKTAALAEAAHG